MSSIEKRKNPRKKIEKANKLAMAIALCFQIVASTKKIHDGKRKKNGEIEMLIFSSHAIPIKKEQEQKKNIFDVVMRMKKS